MKRLASWLLILAVIGAGVGWFLSAPDYPPEDLLTGIEGDAERGATVFAAAGCAACHLAPDDETATEAPVLAGGLAFPSDFGTFYAPNISQHGEAGIGDWTDMQIAAAVLNGVSPTGQHYYPAFPYGSYRAMEAQDLADLIAHLRTLPANATPSRPHDVGFPFNIRRSLGLWKLLFVSDGWQMEEAQGEELERGRYLVEVLGHCAECHTPRNALGGMDRSRWLGGAPHPSGEGTIPNITPGELTWSAADIAEYLKSGFTPDFDTAGGEMAEVVRNTARLTDADRAAIAAYLKALPPV